MTAEPYVSATSSLGDKGMRLDMDPRFMISFGGICKDKPRAGKAGLRDVEGLSIIESSLEIFAGGSRNLGDGESDGAACSRPAVVFDGEPN